MKNIYKVGLSLTLVFILSACGEESFDVGDGGVLGAIMAPVSNVTYLGGISTGVEVGLNPYANDGVSITAINVTKTLQTTAGESEPVTYQVSGETFEQTSSELFADVPVGDVVQSNSTLTPGDTWVLTYSMTLSDGRTMDIGTTTIITFLCAPYPGVWSIDMHDSYGDGWQTDDGNGGAGIQVTLDDGTVLEFGLCSPYQPSDFTCTVGVSDGSTTITIPDGTQEASWYFPGDYWGEISFEIYGPDGSLVYSVSEGADAGILPVILCAP